MNATSSYASVNRWRLVSAAFCGLFGIAFILNVHPIGDGMWFWYARFLREGQKLYADMHLPLPPFFVLITAWAQGLLGLGWLASKAIALAQLSAFCILLFLLAGFLNWKDWQRGIMIACTFLFSLGAIYARFDDYHVTGYCFELLAIYLLLRTTEDLDLTGTLALAAGLGLISGLSMSNRLNDGGALFGACGLTLPFFIRVRRILALSVFSVAAALALFGIVLLSGDSVHNWATYSIFKAAAIKGGPGGAFLRPFTFPFILLRALVKDHVWRKDVLCALLFSALWTLLPRYGRGQDGRLRTWRVLVAAAGLLAFSWQFLDQALDRDMGASLSAAGVEVCYALGIWVVSSFLFNLRCNGLQNCDCRELLILFPFLQLQAGSITSGQTIEETFAQVAIFLLVVPISMAALFRQQKWRFGYLALAAVMGTSILVAKVAHPYRWLIFQDGPMFVGREWYRHPVYGPMYIESDQLKLVRGMCEAIGKDGPATELLSITNPYPNWFCNVPPWHGNVQTWYDTSSQASIETLTAELDTSPPKWIVYQRSLNVLEVNEKVIVKHALPHRALDKLIVTKVETGQWKIVQFHHFEDADWVLIQTKP